MEDNKKRNMPKVAQIYKYWQEKYGLAPWTAGKHARGKGEMCFACSWQGRLERAHIIAKFDGGTDDVSNLHLLCKTCHQMQEVICATPKGREKWLQAIEHGTPFLQAKLIYVSAAAELLGDDKL